MDCQQSLFQSLCVFLIASSAYGGKLPTSITSQYTVCYEFRKFSSEVDSISSSQSSSHIDNVCMNLDGTTYHFLSSAQGGLTSFVTAPISKMTVTYLFLDTLGITLRSPSQPVLGFRCHFQELTHALNVYNSVYKFRSLTRENVKISRIQAFLLDPDNGDRIASHLELSQQAVLYTEFYDSTRKIFAFKEESVDGDAGNAVLILMAYKFQISDVFEDNNVILHYKGDSQPYYVLTFHDESETNQFCKSLRGYFDPNTLVSIPPGLQEVLEIVMSIFQN